MKVVVGVWRLLRGLGLAILAIVLFIEEWGWRPLAAAAARLGKLPPIAWLERQVVKAPPRLALFLFLAPAIVLFPLKIAALWLMDKGRAELGIVLILLAKIVGTAVVGRLFVLLEPQLMSFAWFVRILHWWHGTKATVREAMRGSLFWRRARAARRAWRQWLARVTH